MLPVPGFPLFDSIEGPSCEPLAIMRLPALLRGRVEGDVGILTLD